MRNKLITVGMMLCLLAGIASAQTITGSVTGTVTDSSGAAMPNVKVMVTNTGTGISNTTQANAAGVYNFPFLAVGEYTATAENQGFKKTVLGPFRLEVNQIARLDFKLEVGDVSQSVEVTDIAPILQTESTATGDTITSTKLTSLPLNGRNFANLVLLIPGAISTNPGAMSTSSRFQGGGSRPQVNGNREQTNNFLLDGVDVNDSIDNLIGYQPNVDALEEVKVLTGNAGGEFGNVGGASVVMTLKSGTNQIHGNVFEFLRNEKLDANGFFRNRTNQARLPLRRNIFGGTLGGPIKANKLFYFVDYEGTEQRQSGPASASVAPQDWRNGDLTRFPQATILDPFSGTSSATRTPFPNKQVPRARFSPVANFLFANPDIYPLPNNTGTGALGVGSNYLSGTRSKLRNHQADAKIDWRASDKDNVFGRWSIGRYESAGSQAALPTTLTGLSNGPTTSAVIGWTRSFSTSMVTDTRISFSQIGIDNDVNDWSGKLGLDGNQKFGIAGGQPIAGLSSVALGGGLSGIGTGASNSSTRDNKYQLQELVTYQTGAHLLKVGGQLLRIQQNRFYAGNNGVLGIFRYNGGYTNVDYGDFLVNALSGKGRGSNTGKWGHRHWRNAIFFQDDWKARRNLTLNLGLRWEYITPIYEVADRQINVNTFTGELITPGSGQYGRALYKPYRKSFMPNLGFAWTPDMFNNKLVVRAGYRFSTYLEGTGANLRLTLNPPFFIETDVVYDAATPGDIRIGFADVATANVTLNGPRTGSAPALQGRAWDLDLRPQFTNQFNFALEYQLSNSTSVSAAYVGQRGTHLVAPHEANQPLPGTGAPSTWAPLNDRRPLARVLPNLSNIALTESSATMWYNSLQMSARRRLSNGLEVLASYTFSKTMSDNLGYYGCGGVSSDGAYWQNAYDRRANYGPACFDARHNFTVGGTYELPVGKGKMFGSSFGKALDLVLGGWNINYLLATHSGFPLTITAAAHQNNTLQSVRGNVRANRYREANLKTNDDPDRYFGTPFTAASFCASGVNDGSCAYGIPALGEFGSAAVGTERAPMFFNLDSSIGKKFNITERKYIDFRAEFFNIMNYVSWGPPGRDITSPASFGVIGSQIGSARNIQFGLKYYF